MGNQVCKNPCQARILTYRATEEEDGRLGAAAAAAAAAAGRAADAERALGAAQRAAEALLNARGGADARLSDAKQAVAVRAVSFHTLPDPETPYLMPRRRCWARAPAPMRASPMPSRQSRFARGPFNP